MGALGLKLRTLEGGGLLFWCPGCKEAHKVNIGQSHGPTWEYNNNKDAPTFYPSILIRAIRIGMDGEYTDTVCHSFITNGNIQFGGYCTHELAGQTVPLPNFDV